MHKEKATIKFGRIQFFRILALLAVIGFFVLVPLSNRYANFKIAYNNGRLVELGFGKVQATIYRQLDKIYGSSDNPVKAATSNNGSLWAYTILGVPISDPLGLISELINSVNMPIKYLMGGLIPFALAFLFGRFFCAWLCPMVVINFLSGIIRKVLDYFGVPLLKLKIEEKTRAILFWAGLVFSYFMGAWVWHFILPYISFTHEIFSFVIFQTFTIGIYYLLGVVLLEIAVIPGQFCKSVCPTGFLLSQFGRIQVLKLKIDKSKCPQGCHDCYDVCPIQLFPKTDTLFSCHLCMHCSDTCPVNNIKLGVNELYLKKKRVNE